MPSANFVLIHMWHVASRSTPTLRCCCRIVSSRIATSSCFRLQEKKTEKIRKRRRRCYLWHFSMFNFENLTAWFHFPFLLPVSADASQILWLPFPLAWGVINLACQPFLCVCVCFFFSILMWLQLTRWILNYIFFSLLFLCVSVQCVCEYTFNLLWILRLSVPIPFLLLVFQQSHLIFFYFFSLSHFSFLFKTQNYTFFKDYYSHIFIIN